MPDLDVPVQTLCKLYTAEIFCDLPFLSGIARVPYLPGYTQQIADRYLVRVNFVNPFTGLRGTDRSSPVFVFDSGASS
jgi:hypothetical protein